jgi:hypothetical protein
MKVATLRTTVRMEARDAAGGPLFGAIAQTVVRSS